MRRRILASSLAAGLFTIATAGTALGAHCVNESKKADAGEHGTVIIDVATEVASFDGINPGGVLPGGFADVWLDFNGDGIGDLQVEEGIFLASNHSHRANPAQGTPGVLPPVLNGADPGGDGRGVGTAD
jgi:hypothetical protein